MLDHAPSPKGPVYAAALALVLALGCGGNVVVDANGAGANASSSSSVGGARGCTPYTGTATPITAMGVYGGYLVTDVVNEGAPCAAYGFSPAGGDITAAIDATVDVERSGAVVTTLDYPWRTTVGAGASFTFDFTGYFAITVTNGVGGTQNLYGMPQSIFDGQHVLVVP